MGNVSGARIGHRKGGGMNKLLNHLSNLLPTGLLVLGAIAISGGIGMIYLPAGIIAAGVLAVCGGALLIWGGGENDE